ncbi:MAG TPA: SDR family oxidoreductase [Polyangiaceae bacterium]|nr:SDR family oxidoreductase [Polyangiaceae bacterium]HYQ28702.1 SDR family oxidoreductase [Polyangiaceae bacterium]
MTESIQQSIAVITGGSRGLGKSMALRLAERGVDSIISYHSAASEAQAVLSEIESKGRKCVALRLDASDSSSFGAFSEAVQRALADVWQRRNFDFLINNAGIGVYASLAQTSEAQFDELMKVHLKAPFFLTQTLLPLIVDGGRILNVSSGLSRFTFPGYGAYAAMKGGVEVLTRYLAKELGARRISVNTLAPGAIETDFGGGVVRDDSQLNALIASGIALGRVGLPDDIGRAVVMLLSPESAWINGQRIEVSGGQML